MRMLPHSGGSSSPYCGCCLQQALLLVLTATTTAMGVVVVVVVVPAGGVSAELRREVSLRKPHLVRGAARRPRHRRLAAAVGRGHAEHHVVDDALFLVGEVAAHGLLAHRPPGPARVVAARGGLDDAPHNGAYGLLGDLE